MKRYDKLVRDKIPEILKEKGIEHKFHVASPQEYRKKLWEKLQEEVDELKKNPSIGEVADVSEVLDALGSELGFSKTEVEEIKNNKALARGKFLKRIILEES